MIDITKWSNQYLSDQLIALRENLIDKNDAKAIVISIQDAVTKQAVVLSANEQASINKIIWLLLDKSVSAAIWWSIYDQSKAEIISYMPTNLDALLVEEAQHGVVGQANLALAGRQQDDVNGS